MTLKDPRNHARILVLGALLFALSLAIYIAVVRGAPRGNWSMLDLQIYRWAGVRARHGVNAYHGTYQGLSYTYTPFALLLSAVGSLASLPVLRWVVTVTSIVSLLGTLWVVLGMAGLERGRLRVGLTLGATGLALRLEPVTQTLQFGQINLILMGLVVLDLAQPDTRRWKGLGVGLAAAIKLTPAIFIAFFLLTRRWRAAAVASGTLVAAVLLGFAVFPSPSREFWVGRLFMDSQRVGGVAYVSNQSLNGLLVRLFHGVGAAEPYWLASAVVVGVCGLLLAARASAAGEELLAVMLCALTGLLVSPISWSHHWVWIAPGIVAAAALALVQRSRLAWGVVVGLVAIFAGSPVRLIWRVPYSENREYRWHGFQPLVGNLYVIVGLVLLGLAAAYLHRARASRGAGPAPHPPPAEAVSAARG